MSVKPFNAALMGETPGLLQENTVSKIKSIFEIQRGEQKIRIDDPDQEFGAHFAPTDLMAIQGSFANDMEEERLSPSHPHEHIISHAKYSQTPQANMLAPSHILTTDGLIQ